jgi:cytochrome c-type biogenesis protein CcmH
MRLAAVAVALALAAPAAAAEPRTTLPDVEDEVMCVTCKVPLNVADAPQADAQRDQIRRLIARGLTKDQIKARLVAEYGEDVLAEPEDDGVGLASWAVPAAIVLAMVLAAALLLPRWRRTGSAPGAPAAPGPAVSDTELRRLDDDLARYD